MIAQDRSVMVLQLDKVNMMMAQRPAASNMLVNLTMHSLTVTGIV